MPQIIFISHDGREQEVDAASGVSVMQAAVDNYIAAQESGDMSKMSLGAEVKYFENMSESTKEKGLWNTALPIALHRRIFLSADFHRFTRIQYLSVPIRVDLRFIF